MSKVGAALAMKCPRCQKGALFIKKNPYTPNKMLAMHTNCSNCELKYERETGFFFGAMYVSYMLNIALFVTSVVGYFLFFEDTYDWKSYIIVYVVITLMLTPVIFRLSRSIWLQIMVKFEPQKRGER